MTGKDLKEMLCCIPDNAFVTIDNNARVEVTGISVESDCINGIHADIKITEGFSITCDEVCNRLFEDLKMLYKAMGDGNGKD